MKPAQILFCPYSKAVSLNAGNSEKRPSVHPALCQPGAYSVSPVCEKNTFLLSTEINRSVGKFDLFKTIAFCVEQCIMKRARLLYVE